MKQINDTKDMIGDINSNIKVELDKPDQSEEEISLKDADVYTLKEQF